MNNAPGDDGELPEEEVHNDIKIEQNTEEVKPILSINKRKISAHAQENAGKKFGLEILACIRKSNAFEKIPKVIDNLIKEIGIYKKSGHPPDSDFKNAFEKVKHLQHEIQIQLEKIRKKKWYSPVWDFFAFCTRVPEMSPSPTSPTPNNHIAFNTVDTNGYILVNRQIDVSQVEPSPVQTIATQPNNFVLSNGESFQYTQLVRSAHTNLEQLTIFFCPVWRAADEADKVFKGAFGLHLYSEKFRQLCFLWAASEKILDENSCNYQKFREIVETLTYAEHKNNLYEVSLNAEIVAALKKLEAVLNDELYELCAIMNANKLFSIFPAYCKGVEQKYCLECIEHACNVLINVSDNRDYKGIFSENVKDGIVCLQKEYIKLQIFCK